MNSNYTTKDLLRFLYKEMDENEAATLQLELQNNALLNKEYQQLKEAHAQLYKEHYEPDDTSVNLVMDYSASYYSAPEHHTE